MKPFFLIWLHLFALDCLIDRFILHDSFILIPINPVNSQFNLQYTGLIITLPNTLASRQFYLLTSVIAEFLTFACIRFIKIVIPEIARINMRYSLGNSRTIKRLALLKIWEPIMLRVIYTTSCNVILLWSLRHFKFYIYFLLLFSFSSHFLTDIIYFFND